MISPLTIAFFALQAFPPFVGAPDGFPNEQRNDADCQTGEQIDVSFRKTNW